MLRNFAAGHNAVVTIRNTVDGVADLLWPPRCCVCHTPDEHFLCHDCIQTVHFIQTPYCSRCGRPECSHGCPDCDDSLWPRKTTCDTLRQVALFEGVWRTAIHRYKYDGLRVLAAEMAGHLVDWLDNAAVVWREMDVVVPVPGHILRGWELGYHHASLLAEIVARHLDIPLQQPLRRLPGKSQMSLNRQQRIDNAPRLYALRRDYQSLSGKKVLLIDDVVTTGATAHAVAALLKSAGARKVRMLALARNL